MELLDRPGSLAAATAALGQREVSIHRMRQYDHMDNAPVLIVHMQSAKAHLQLRLQTQHLMMPLLAPLSHCVLNKFKERRPRMSTEKVDFNDRMLSLGLACIEAAAIVIEPI